MDSQAIAEIKAQEALQPGQEGWWPVWGASVLDIQVGDVVVDSEGPYEVLEVVGKSLTKRGFRTNEGEIWVGFLANVKVIRKGTGHSLSDTCGDPDAARAAYERIQAE